jgi:transcription antitermination factor NusG
MPLDANTPQCVATPEPAVGDLGCRGIATPRWAVAQTHPQAEHFANTNLQRSGYQTFLPLHTIQRRDRTIPNLVHALVVPLFTRYLFVAHDNPDLWRPIRETPGVASVITAGGKVQYARAGEVEAVQAAQAFGRSIRAAGASWAPGVPCSLRKGYAFEGLPGVITAIEGERASVAIMFLGQVRQITVPLECLRPRLDDRETPG